jgi:N-acetylmuramoyl-L-alanine amidase
LTAPAHVRRLLARARAAVLLLVLSAALPSGAVSEPAARRVEVSADFTAVLTGGAIRVEARPLEGETPIEFARRIGRDEATAAQILARPGGLKQQTAAVVPYAGLSDESKRAAVAALFPADLRASAGWLHIAVGDETLAAVAEWFTGSPGLGPAIAAENGLTGASITRGMTVRIPAEHLLPPFRDAEAIGEAAPPHLTFGSDEKGPYALYRLQKKEALYSAVVVRFTGRVHAEDVVELALKIAERSGISDVRAIPVGYPVKIPRDVLSPEFLPEDDPRAQARAMEKAETAQFSMPVVAKNLAGVRVVIDAGHGGPDTGTLQKDIWEATYVYDVACRLQRALSERTQAEVVMTTRDEVQGWKVPNQDRLPNRKARVLLTEPPYALEDPVVGVNLRWYLANSLLNRPGARQKRIPPERTVFLSLHADSLHPSLRGAMAYVPGERFLRDRYGRVGPEYEGVKEWREQPVVSFNRKERVASEGASTQLAEKLIAALQGGGLPIHSFSPVRTHVIRSGREWVPAVLRYNRIPSRVLLEIANLGNREDRTLVVTRKFRQRVADAIASGIVEFFDGGQGKTLAGPMLASRKTSPLAREAAALFPSEPEVYGPWPQAQEPWPEIYGPWPVRPAPLAPAPDGKRHDAKKNVKASKVPVPKPGGGASQR